jgi:hypothetical protein
VTAPVRAAARLAAALACVAAGGAAAGAQDVACERGDREVRSLAFRGNRAFRDAELERVVVTTPSDFVSRLRLIGTRRCLDPDEFARDLLRLVAYYRKRGYPDVAVDTAARALGGGGPNPPVAVTFAVREGEPLRLDSLPVLGSTRCATRAACARAAPRPGDVFDRAALEAAHDTVRQRLRDAGYPRPTRSSRGAPTCAAAPPWPPSPRSPGGSRASGRWCSSARARAAGRPACPSAWCAARRGCARRPGARRRPARRAARALPDRRVLRASTCASTRRRPPGAWPATRSPRCA